MKQSCTQKIPPFLDFNFSSIQYYLIPAILFFFVVLPEKVPSISILAFFYGILPLLDQYCSLDLNNPTKQQVKKLQDHNIYFELCLYVSIIVNWLCFYKIMSIITNQIQSLSYLQIFGHLLLYGNIAALGIIISHQIYHKEGVLKKSIGLISIINTLYIHWTVEHIIGHHRNVATPKDPASASKNMTFYGFFPKTFKGTWVSCYNIQKQKGKSIFTNLAVVSIISTILITGLVFHLYGIKGMTFFVLGGIISFSLLQIINYIEHYGLQRKLLPDGQYERVNIRHSWNTPHRFTNYLMFKLQRHSDHHQNSYKPYQILLTLDDSPQMPAGYTAMLLIALFPQTFFEIMNPLLQYYELKHKGQIPNQELKKVSSKKCLQFAQGMCWKLCALVVLQYITSNLYGIESVVALG